MANLIYEFIPTPPKAEIEASGNLLDPATVRINKALGRYGAIPPYFIKRKIDVITQVEDPGEILQNYSATGLIYSQMPMMIKREADQNWFILPVEPLVSVSGKNVITRRTVAKTEKGGTIKERWSQDDYDVTIQGLLTAQDQSEYPGDYVKKLIELFNEKQAVAVYQEVLWTLGIKSLAIESASFPHTKGLNNQNYEIKAYSDNTTELLITI